MTNSSEQESILLLYVPIFQQPSVMNFSHKNQTHNSPLG